MKIKTTSVLLAALLGVFVPVYALAATVTLPAGTELNVTIDQTLDTKTANVGDHFTAHVQPPYPFGNGALAGAVVTGQVTSVQHAGQGTKPALDIRFDSMQLSDGSTGPMDAFASAAQPKTQMKNGTRVVPYTIAGMLVGNAIVKTVFAGKHGGEAGAAGAFCLAATIKRTYSFRKARQ